MRRHTIELAGTHLTSAQVAACVADARARVAVPRRCLAAIARSAAFLERQTGRQLIYGVNTGFGPMAHHVMGRAELAELQQNLVRSHATGVGDPVPAPFVLAAMIARLNTLARGRSGASPELARTLQRFINRRIVPIVPAHGAVGASGDLVQLAHIALALIGEGEVLYRGRRQRTAAVLARLRIRPHRLRVKEGLALINGTSFMTGIAALQCVRCERLLDLSIRTGALAMELAQAYTDGISAELSALRPHPGQVAVAARLRSLLATSSRLRQREETLGRHTVEAEAQRLAAPVQEVYSLRCLPQILGPVQETLATVQARVEIELNAVTDNPIVLLPQRRFLHGGNFHGEYVASGMDQLKAAVVKLTMLSERRINLFLHPALNQTLPPFMNLARPGLNLGLQGLQFPATSTTAQSQTLAFPMAVHSIPTNGDNQDVVSMGTDAALLASQVVDNAYVVLAIEAIVLAQAVDYLRIGGRLCDSSRRLYKLVRSKLAAVGQDRVIYQEVAALLQALQ